MDKIVYCSDSESSDGRIAHK